ncbi:MAG: DUF2341 domain-containing protein [Verrucomicrobia bacterium]|nr:DUF2341 domain-containing protein [Verrucomicrobiota bacterium]
MKQFAVGMAVGLALWAASSRADTTISAGGTFTIDDTNTTLSGTTRTWTDTGILSMFNGATLQTWPTQINTVANNDAIAFKGAGGTYSLRYNANDTDFMMNGAITSTATGAQTLAILTGYGGNGDRESVTFNSGIPNVGDGSTLSLNVTFKTQTGSQSWVNLPAVNTFTGPITLVQGSGGPPTGYLTIGGKLTRNNGNTNGSGTLNSGNYPGAIALGTATILNYASSAPQTLAGVISGVGALQVNGSGALTLSGTNTYTGDTTVNSGSTLVLGSGGGLKFVVTDASNNKVTGGGSATLKGSFTIDTSAVTAISGSWTLVNATTKSFDGSTFSVAGFTKSGSVFTKLVGAQNWTFSTATGVLSLSSKAIITSFGIPGSAGVINQTSKTIALTVPWAPWGTSLAPLAPTFTLTSGSCNQTSGSPPSPTFAAGNPAHYVVTDGSVVNDYAVTVSVTPASSACDITACDFGVLGAATVSGTGITLTVPVGTVVTGLAPIFTLSSFATISPASGIAQDFTNPVIYTVTAQNGTTKKTYTVTVQTYQSWLYNASLFILTTPEGANLPATASEMNFPLLVRLNSGNFTFSQAASDGRDIRFTTLAGAALPYQIEQWDAVSGTAAVWVKIPTITGNARQELKMYWGKSGTTSESSGTAVFNAANGYVSVFHLNETLTDAVGTLTPTPANGGPSLATGLIGKGRTFTVGQGVNCGDNLTTLPSGNTAHSTQVWFRSNSSNFDIVDWGVENPGNKVQIRLLTPPRIYIDGNGASVTGASTLTTAQWHQVVHTYSPGLSRIYIDGRLDASGSVNMTITPPSIMRLGGWYGTYGFVGDMDEVRLSKVARTADWIKLEYENQKVQQTLVGNPVQPGTAFSVTPTTVTINEGTSTTLTAQAGGAQMVYWIEKKNGVDTVLATDQFTLNVAAGRVTGNPSYVIQFKAIYPTTSSTIDIPVTIIEDLPDPVFTLSGPATWDGRQTITVTPSISNLGTLQAKNVANMTYNWSVAGVAVTKQITAGTPTVPGSLTLTRSQGSGPMTVTLVLDNGGSLVTATETITVQEPASDAWVQRTPGATEKPVTGQFFARDPNTGNGMVYYNGTGVGTTPVYLKIYTTDTGTDVQYGTTLRQTPVAGGYAFTAPIAAGKVTYKVEFGTTTGGTDTPSGAAITNLVCGDAYIIEGQSNALATDNTTPSDPTTDPWIRTYGASGGGWGYAINKGTEMQLGLWGLIFAKRLSTNYNMPICIINGAVGGTRIDQHRPNPADHSQAGSLYAIYANLYNRVVAAKLTHGVRAVLWHQGEQDQGSGGPDGDYDYKFYQQYFMDISAAWKGDFPNLRNYYVFQIWPAACGDTSRNDQLREVQRTLPNLYSNMRIMTTVGIVPGSGCHYVLEGYQKFSDLIGPLVEQDHYGYLPGAVFTAPDLKKAYFTTSAHNEITLEFGQNMTWIDANKSLIYLDGVANKVSAGSVTGKVIKLTLPAASTATTITYLQGIGWNGVQGNLLYGTNGIAALTFADVIIALPAPTGLTATSPDSSRMILGWNPSSGATGYKVKRSVTRGGPYTQLGTPTTASFTDFTVSAGTTYYYVVSATNGTDESANSTEVGMLASLNGTGVADITLERHPGTGSATTYGDALSFDVTVSGSAIPTGMVTLKDGGAGGTTIGSATLAGGICTIAPALSALTPGSHANLVAVYSGDSDFAATTSSALSAQTVSPKALTVTGTAVTSKTYDGGLTTTLTGATLSGVVSGDTVTLGNATSGTFNSKGVGTGKSVACAMTISGASAGYYTLTQPALTGEIKAKALTVTGTTVTTKTYDGNQTATLTGGALVGVVGGDVVTLNASGTFDTRHVGTGKVVTSTSTLAGAPKDNYTLTQPSGLTGTITALVVTLSGSRTYDGTTSVAAANLAIGNQVSGDDLSLSGSASLAAKHAGAQNIVFNYVTPVRVRSATGNTGASAAATIPVNMGTAPVNGNTMVAVISTRGTSSGRVTGITQTGAAWARAAQTVGTAGTTTEIWFAPNVSGAGAAVTINQSSLLSAAVVMEYSGVLTVRPLDKTASATGNGATAATGTTATTTQANELWIGGLGLVNSSYSLSAIQNSFTAVASAQSTNGTPTSNAKVYALEKIEVALGTASSSATITSSQWSGAMATFRAASTLTLAGTEQNNYTLIGATGSVTINQLATTVTAVSASKTYDGTTSAAGTPTIIPALADGDTTTTCSQAFQTKDAGTANKVIVPSIVINDGNGGANYAVTLQNFTTGTIDKAPATVTLGSLAQTYDGTPKAATATTDPADLAVTFTYDDATDAPTAAGSYAVVASVSEMNYAGSANGTLVITAEPMDLWRESHFTPEEITAGLAADGVDADGDGFSNLDEYTLGTDPRAFTPQPLVLAPAADNQFTLTFVARRATGVGYDGLTRRYAVEGSSNLANPDSWQPVTGYTALVGGDQTSNILGDEQTVIVTLPIAAPNMFYRLNVRVD